MKNSIINKILKITADISLSALLLTNMTAAVSAISPPINQSGSWQYYDNGDYITVCGYLGSEEHITIPSEIEGKAVEEVTCITETGYSGVDFFGNNRSTGDKIPPPAETSVKRITFPDTVKRIGDYTFYKCLSLEQADLPQNLTVIGEGAFKDCTDLTKADIPQSVKTIGALAFNSTSVSRLDLPEGLEYIGYAAFAHTAITEAIIPDTVEYIGKSAFLGCLQLEYAKLSKNMRTLSESMFGNCISLKNIEIPEGVSIIEMNAFGTCMSLEEIHFPKSVISVKSIFFSTSSLKDIYFEADKEYVDAFRSVWTDDGILTSDTEAKTDIMSLMVWSLDTGTDYSGVNIHFGEKPAAEGNSQPISEKPQDPLKTVFIILTAVFALTLVITLYLYLSQKLHDRRRIREENTKQFSAIPQGNALTRLDSFNGVRCKNCGAENGEKASYCLNCGKKLKTDRQRIKENKNEQ